MSCNSLSSFAFDDALVRVSLDQDGAPWFVAKDVCIVLGLSNTSDAINPLDDDEKGIGITDTLRGPQEMLTVSESGLYSLIFRSRKPEARRFRKWVTAEVLPAIRKTGRFARPASLPESLPVLLEGGDVPHDVLALKPRMRERGLDLSLQFARQTGITDAFAIRALFLECCRLFAARAGGEQAGAEESRMVRAWAARELENAPSGPGIQCVKLYAAFCDWFAAHGQGKVPSLRVFGATMKNLFLCRVSNKVYYFARWAHGRGSGESETS